MKSCDIYLTTVQLVGFIMLLVHLNGSQQDFLTIFLFDRLYLCVNNGHNNNFNRVLIIFRYIWITFINIIRYKYIVLLSILSSRD